ncbi:unnamed protein product [Rotaria sp. Silwood2]|nr:unnamed protein product [Rotaria sp. Silwood2]CAF2499135.1 unnamed protein product [Rotaria sp. Silwood2]CAF2729320.1 unnamed protein product [Rotaria sp. Silwood2]CAF2896841.1 unnamed protein product [Rotaria sp. Silwood2]CAF3950099.1 unnamed protein product [Rotaria sp. Silwood2]
MEIDFAHSHNPTLFGSLSVSPPTSMLDSFSPLLHLNDDFLDVLNPTTTTTTTDDDADDWMKPLLLDQLFEHDFLSPQFSNDDIEIKQEKQQDDEKRKLTTLNNNCSFIIDEKFLSNNYSQQQHENDFFDFFQQHSSEQRLPTTTTTLRLIHQPKIEPAELPTTLYLNGNELQFHPIVTTNNTMGHTYTTTTSSPMPSVPIQPSVPIVPARVLKGKKFKRGGRVSSRATSRSHAATKRRLNSTAAEPKASVVIIAEDATRIDSKTTTLGLSSTGSCSNDTDLLKSSSSSTTTSTRSSTRRRVKSTPREVILFRNGTFVSKEPITKQQTTSTLCFETTTNNNCPIPPPPLHQQQITATGLQAAAQIVACNVLRQATLNDALIEQLIKREPTNTDDDFPIYCYSSPSLSSSCTMTAAMDEYENSCSTTLKILGCNTTTPLHSTTSNNTTTTTIELLTFAALQQQQQHQPQFCYIKQEPGTTTTTTTFLLPRLLPQ